MPINTELNCPHCHSRSVVRNGRKRNGSQNYPCKRCRKRFVSDREKTYRGSLSWIPAAIKIMTVRGNGVRDISAAPAVSIQKVLKVLCSLTYRIQPKRKHCDCLEADVFWTYVGRKADKVRLVYAYHRGSGETAAYVRGKRDLKTA